MFTVTISDRWDSEYILCKYNIHETMNNYKWLRGKHN